MKLIGVFLQTTSKLSSEMQFNSDEVFAIYPMHGITTKNGINLRTETNIESHF